MPHWVYWSGIPVLCGVCAVSLAVNARVLWVARRVRRPLSATLRISLSLAAADAVASSLLCVGMLANSYLPKVWNMQAPVCACLAIEALRVAAILVTVLHLLALACNHHVGIARPLHYARIVTRRTVSTLLVVLWLAPPLYFFAYFSLVPGEGFSAPGCPNEFLDGMVFRAMFVAFLVIPLVVMCAIYEHILVLVRSHRRLWARRQHARQRQAMARNVRAVQTTLLILGSFVAGLLPATMVLVLCCQRCTFHTCPTELMWLVNLLVIVKTLANPIIYAARMHEIKEAAASSSSSARRPHTSPMHLPDGSWRLSARSALCRLTSNGGGATIISSSTSPQQHIATAV